MEDLDIKDASSAGNVEDTDFIYAPRVLELYHQFFNTAPVSQHSDYLLSENIISKDGSITSDFFARAKSPTPFMRFGSEGSWHLTEHFIEIFKSLLKRIQFSDLDDLLNKRTIKAEAVIGTFCYYVGGLYGRVPATPITDETPPTHLYFHRRDFWVQWMVDVKYMVSKTALYRLADHNVYIVYGRIRNDSTKTHNGKEYNFIDIRPYLFGFPIVRKTRTPLIHYLENAESEFE